jgi:voltage-gated sodium channel
MMVGVDARKVAPDDALTTPGVNATDNSTAKKMTAKVERGQSGLFEFANSQAIREKVRAAKMRPNKYNVHNEYWEEGTIQWIAKHTYFENVTLGVIVLNAIWIAIDTDYNTAPDFTKADAVFVTADCLFFGYFVVELAIRFLAFKRKVKCFQDGWFVFDATLVALYAFDPFILAIAIELSGGGSLNLPTAVLRLFRLARLSRLVRMLRQVPELMIMIKGMAQAARTVNLTLVLLLVITYIFAIALTQLSDGSEFREIYFTGVGLSMYSLIIYGTFLDNLAEFCDNIRAESTVCLMVVVIFIVLASLTVMNMLIGVLCEVVSSVAEEENESMITDKVHDKFDHIVKQLDSSGDQKLSWKEFQKIMENQDAIDALESVHVDPVGMIDFAQDWFQEDGKEKSIDFEEFMTIVLDLRGGQQATLKDLMTLGKRVKNKFSNLSQKMESVDTKLDEMIKEAEGAQ